MASRIVITDSDSDTTEDAQIARVERLLKEKTEKERKKKLNKATKTVTRDSRRDVQRPQDRLKQMILVLDSTLSENRDLMEALVEELEEAGVEYRVGEGGPVGSIRWRRKQKERNVTDDARITEFDSEREENHLLLTLEAQGFAGLVQYSKMTEQGILLPDGSQTLQDYIGEVKRQNNDMNISLAVEGMDKYFRGNKTRANRQFRKRVLGKATSTSDGGGNTCEPPEVTWVDCQAAIVSLQLMIGCSVRLCPGPEELAEYVFTLTKAVSEKPFQKESKFSFHPDAATTHKKRAVDSESQLSATWKNQLMQFNNLSEPMASAVVAQYPTPAHLIEAYGSCDNAPLLLQDITVRRGVGTVASTRRLGPVQSQRIHLLLTTADPHVTIT